MRSHCTAVVATLLVSAALLPAQGRPAPEEAELSCKVRRVEPSGEHALLVQVAVKSTAERFAEPAELLVTLGEVEHRVRRLPQPEAGRRGRAVPPRGEQSYWLIVPAQGRPRGRPRLDVRVVRALFHDGPALEAAPVTIGAIRHEHVSETGMRYEVSRLATENSLDRPVDVLLLARCAKPENVRWLFPVRVPPGRGEVVLDGLAPTLDWEPASARTLGVRIAQAEVVDWTASFDVPDAPVLAEFENAWRAWRRWDAPPVGVGGRFRLRTSRTESGKEVTSRMAGRFTIGPGGEPSLEVVDVAGTDDRTPPRAPFALALRDLRRPSLAELRAHKTPRPFDATRVSITGTGEREEFGDLFEVRDGRIVASGPADMHAQAKWTWTLEPLGAGYVVARRTFWQQALGEHITELREHVLLPGGVVFPTRLVRDERYGELTTRYELVLHDLESNAPVASDAPPTGAAADALRAAWDAVHAYPDARFDVTADIEVEHRNTDGVWAGVQRVRGKLRLGGFRGFTMHDRGWRECTFEAQGKDLSAATRAALENAVDDRLGLWRGRDLAGRAPFDVAFRGATVRETSPGTFTVEGGAVDRLVVEGGVPCEVRFVGGRHSFYRWQKVGAAFVVAEVRSGGETLTARFRDAGHGVLFPTELRFEKVFGADWGPETLKFTNVRVTPSE